MSIQEEHKAWLAARYPNQPSFIPAAGMIEEAGELLHCFVAKARMALFGAESRNADVDAELFDAIGDCYIYFVSYCNTVGESVQRYSDARTLAGGRDSMTLAADLVKAAYDVYMAKTFSFVPLYRYVALLRCIAEMQNLVLEDVVNTVWKKVRERCK